MELETRMIKKQIIALVPAALLLAGCISTSAPVHVQHFTLAGAGSAPASSAEQAGVEHRPILRIAEITAPNWLDGTNLYYRLAYKDNAQISAYSQSEWVAPPPVLIGNVLQSTLAGSGQWKAILGPRDVTRADVAIKIQLDNFAQTFSSTEQSQGVLDATATVIDGKSNGIIAQRHFHIEKPATSADAAGGVQALSKAAHAFASKLAPWLAKATHQNGNNE
jgi:cholesterol transport system auxiliary component